MAHSNTAASKRRSSTCGAAEYATPNKAPLHNLLLSVAHWQTALFKQRSKVGDCLWRWALPRPIHFCNKRYKSGVVNWVNPVHFHWRVINYCDWDGILLLTLPWQFYWLISIELIFITSKSTSKPGPVSPGGWALRKSLRLPQFQHLQRTLKEEFEFQTVYSRISLCGALLVYCS